MHKPMNGEIILPGTAERAPRPKTLEEQVVDQLPQEDAQAGIAICQRLATETKGIGAIAAAVLGLPDDEQGRQVAKTRFYRMRVRSAALMSLYMRARESRADILVDEIVEIADAPLPKCSDAVELKAEVEARRLKVHARQWAAGKLNRLLYSDDPQRPGVQVTINNNDNDGRHALEVIRERIARKRKAMIEAGLIKPEPGQGMLPAPADEGDKGGGRGGA